MCEGLQMASLATLIGKPNAAKWGTRRVTICAAGRRGGEPFIMATDSSGTVILGMPSDFTIPPRKGKKARRIKGINEGDVIAMRQRMKRQKI